MKFLIAVNNRSFEVEILEINGDRVITLNGKQVGAELKLDPSGKSAVLTIANRPFSVRFASDSLLTVDGIDISADVKDSRLEALLSRIGARNETSRSAGEIRAPMPGLIVKNYVQEGEMVQIGQSVCVVEAMKMENEIRSPIAGVVKRCDAKPGKAIDKGELLMVIESFSD